MYAHFGGSGPVFRVALCPLHRPVSLLFVGSAGAPAQLLFLFRYVCVCVGEGRGLLLVHFTLALMVPLCSWRCCLDTSACFFFVLSEGARLYFSNITDLQMRHKHLCSPPPPFLVSLLSLLLLPSVVSSLLPLYSGISLFFFCAVGRGDMGDFASPLLPVAIRLLRAWLCACCLFQVKWIRWAVS